MTTPHLDPVQDIDLSRVHLIGIGGAGMSGVARILLARGKTVTGSDAKESRTLMPLRAVGAKIAIGHSRENLDLGGELPTAVVTSFAAIPKDNPELLRAQEEGIPVIRRSDLLGELMEGYTQVLIAGTHGKTSTTSMAVVAMQAASMDPSFAIGGQLNKAGTNAHHGTGEVFIAEADESDASLLRYSPHIAVVTNVEPDHLDFFKTHEAYFQVFDDFAGKITPNGTLVVCLNDTHAAELGERAVRKGIKTVGYGTVESAEAHPSVPALATILDSQVVAEGTRATIKLDDREVSVILQIPGEHMVLNGAAALLAGYLVGGDVDKLVEGLSDFSGVRRRFEYHGTIAEGQYEGTTIFDDYAHHPTEVSAVLGAARERVEAAGKGRVIVAFQPHLYSRTLEFHKEFAEALSLADAAVVLEIYGAREQPIDGVSAQMLTDAMTIPAVYEPNFSAVPDRIAELAGPHDIVLTMGAGSVTMLAPEILDRLQD